ncbi:MAG: CRISPR-associated endonuclease Cas3'', partial [Desulfovibrionaceae bacterium]|nr:CRISPR-associated endonuclease Cas3'' [Desulfovibrionaceae bacterium]
MSGFLARPGQALEGHLSGVAARGAEFAAAFGAGDWGRIAGLWHDLGKGSREFQDYLEAAQADPDAHRRGPDHSTAGAQHAASVLGD